MSTPSSGGATAAAASSNGIPRPENYNDARYWLDDLSEVMRRDSFLELKIEGIPAPKSTVSPRPVKFMLFKGDNNVISGAVEGDAWSTTRPVCPKQVRTDTRTVADPKTGVAKTEYRCGRFFSDTATLMNRDGLLLLLQSMVSYYSAAPNASKVRLSFVNTPITDDLEAALKKRSVTPKPSAAPQKTSSDRLTQENIRSWLNTLRAGRGHLAVRGNTLKSTFLISVEKAQPSAPSGQETAGKTPAAGANGDVLVVRGESTVLPHSSECPPLQNTSVAAYGRLLTPDVVNPGTYKRICWIPRSANLEATEYNLNQILSGLVSDNSQSMRISYQDEIDGGSEISLAPNVKNVPVLFLPPQPELTPSLPPNAAPKPTVPPTNAGSTGAGGQTLPPNSGAGSSGSTGNSGAGTGAGASTNAGAGTNAGVGSGAGTGNGSGLSTGSGSAPESATGSESAQPAATEPDGLSVGAIIGIAVGVFLLLILVALASYFAVRAKKKRSADAENASFDQSEFNNMEISPV